MSERCRHRQEGVNHSSSRPADVSILLGERGDGYNRNQTRRPEAHLKSEQLLVVRLGRNVDHGVLDRRQGRPRLVPLRLGLERALRLGLGLGRDPAGKELHVGAEEAEGAGDGGNSALPNLHSKLNFDGKDTWRACGTRRFLPYLITLDEKSLDCPSKS